jgi:hypothetical protein
VIVFADRSRRVRATALLAAVRADAEALAAAPDAPHALTALMAAGDLEAAVMDASRGGADADPARECRLRAVSVAAAEAFHQATRGSGAAVGRTARTLAERLDALPQAGLPSSVEVRVPEGYAYYGLHPEAYLEAAEHLAADHEPQPVVVLGIRSIGTSLSAVVAATLEAAGFATESWTVRPQGHPFARRLQLEAPLRRCLAARARSLFAVVDEGPGLSGSSMTSVAEALSALGVPDGRIVFLPAWDPPPERLRNESARSRWRLHRRYIGSSESEWSRSERLARAFGVEGGLGDVSAGQWRALAYGSEAGFPAVHPHHERRKLLGLSGTRRVMLKFEGLGPHGAPRLARARTLWEEGFGPRPLALKEGFVAYEHVEGVPLHSADVDRALLERMGGYVAHLARVFRADALASWERLWSMLEVNVAEALPSHATHLARLETCRDRIRDAPVVGVDGRMLPHEWLRTRSGLLKTDGVDHHDDHFWPGTQDPAWDLAGAAVEFDLDREAREHLIGAYVLASGDSGVGRRLPFYRVAYLAWRLGYATLAGEALAGTPDGGRFTSVRDGYRRALVSALAADAPV